MTVQQKFLSALMITASALLALTPILPAALAFIAITAAFAFQSFLERRRGDDLAELHKRITELSERVETVSLAGSFKR